MRKCEQMIEVGPTNDPRIANVRVVSGATVRVSWDALAQHYGKKGDTALSFDRDAFLRQARGLTLCYEVDAHGNRFWPGRV